MTKSLGNPFSHETDLRHGAGCGCDTCSTGQGYRADGGQSMSSDDMMERVVENAIVGMLPHNKLSRQVQKKLKVYAGPEHPHAAQQPIPFEIKQVLGSWHW